ncbi:hypothetical protein GBF38_018297 [Nibea albiflora]|uniref:Uncharacterized protein n=1 Tax=Nibea albiflora TaxID=240163 RepID=A0ACB7ER33_NIBAL|nr:hypothetical protein GBF38_018297 [Nibea albiflora]
MTAARLGSAQFGSARLGLARPGPARPGRLQLHPLLLQAPQLQRRSWRLQGRGTAAELGLRSVSSRSAAIALEVRLGSDSVLCRRTAAAFHLPFSRQKGRGCRKEGGKEENARGALGNVVHIQEHG